MLTIPIYDTILLPDVTFYFKKEVIDTWEVKDFNNGDDIAFAMLRDDIAVPDVTFEDIFPIGVVARVESIDSDGNVKVRTKDRINFLDFKKQKNGRIDCDLKSSKANSSNSFRIISGVCGREDLLFSGRILMNLPAL